MCGFAGVVAWDGRYRVGRDTLARMSAAVAHRGPDGEGAYENHAGEASAGRPHAALAFRRLAVLDPDPRSDQPFTIGCKTVVFNGEIYNFRELRAELSRDFPNYQWRTAGDTEVLLRAYDCWGERCVEKFNGMFAFAVWDEAEKTLFLARDRMGQKPLYYAPLGRDGQRADLPATCTERTWTDQGRRMNYSGSGVAAVAFASELPALRAVPWFDRTLNPEALCGYLRWGYIQSPWRLEAGATELMASTTMCFGPDASGARVYFDSEHPAPSTSYDNPVAETRRLVTAAVRRRLVSDVPLGCLLSGGIDSSVVASAMRGAGPVQTFSIAFDDPRYDESEHAEAVAKHLGTRHHTFRVRPDAADDLPKLAAVFGEPFADSSALPTHFLAREVRRHVTVALGGDGGDELFGGYDRYRAMRLYAGGVLPEALEELIVTPKFMSAGRSALGFVGMIGRSGRHPKSQMARLARFVRSARPTLGGTYGQIMRLFHEPLMKRLLNGPLHTHGGDYVADVYASRSWRCGAVESALDADRATYLPGDLLTKVDRASMLHALEVRSPFMDPEVVTFAAGLTADQLLKGGPKRMLREAFAGDLPAWVFTRRKMGFAVPVGEWFRGPLRDLLHDHLFAASSFAASHFNVAVVRKLVEDHESGRADHGQRLYALLMLELWWKNQQGHI